MTDGLYIGLMSGTSMDGIDAALVKISDKGTQLLESHLYLWPDNLRQDLLRTTQQEQCTLVEFGTLDARCGEVFAAATLELLAKASVDATAITAIGSHGQTLHHGPENTTPYSLQIGDPSRIAEITGITTVADFRRRDIAAGGQGAPLVPIFHQAIFDQTDRNTVILNIGGIANISILGAGNHPVTGFDTGPGNCLLDQWALAHIQANYDAGGQWAATGKVNNELLERLLADTYFNLPTPKSTGTDYFSMLWLQHYLDSRPALDAADVQATLLACSATSMTQAIKNGTANVAEILVCGGGVHNEKLMSELKQLLAPVPVHSTQKYAIDPDWIEAMAFAWLACQTINKLPGNLPAVTGAQHSVILGGVYFA